MRRRQEKTSLSDVLQATIAEAHVTILINGYRFPIRFRSSTIIRKREKRGEGTEGRIR
jgi:hypothetical protein